VLVTPVLSPPLRSSLLPLQLFYFLSFGALGSFFPFLPLLLGKRGLDPSQIGWVMMVVPVANVLIPPLWGLAADTLRARLPLLRIAAAGSAITILLMLPNLGFIASIAAIALFSLFRSPLTSLADAASVDALGGRSRQFSRIRVFGSLGFGLFVAALGWLGASSHPVMLTLATAAVYLFATAATVPLRAPPVLPQRGVAADVGHILHRPAVLAFLATSAVYYAGHATYDVFFGLHMEALGLGDGYVGAGWAVGIFAEIVVLLLAPRILGLARTETLLTLCGVASLGRWLGMAHVTSAPGVLALQTLHGVTFGLWYLSLVAFIQARADERTRTTLQSIALSCTGLGAAVASVVGGSVFEHHGGATLFHAAAVTAALSILGYGLLAAGTRRQPETQAAPKARRACSPT